MLKVSTWNHNGLFMSLLEVSTRKYFKALYYKTIKDFVSRTVWKNQLRFNFETFTNFSATIIMITWSGYFERRCLLKIFPRGWTLILIGCLIEPSMFNRTFMIIEYDNSNNKNINDKNNNNIMSSVKSDVMRRILTMWEELLIPNLSNFLKPLYLTVQNNVISSNFLVWELSFSRISTPEN